MPNPGRGRFCSFSPCIEQVQRTCAELHAAGFTDLETVECLRREYSVQTRSFRTVQTEQDVPVTMSCMVLPNSIPGHTGYITCASLPSDWARVESSSPPALEETSVTNT